MSISNAELIRERYQGIRPAPGYPACPDHSLKPIPVRHAGRRPGEISLTENFAMLPTSAVSGFYFPRPDASYFGVARIGQDQLKDYARRRGLDVDVAALVEAQSRLAGEGPLAVRRCFGLTFIALIAAPAVAQLPPRGMPSGPSWLPGPAVPGGEVELAILMHTDPGWHGYWLNPGDAGLPMRIEWQLPEGARLAPLRYPVPDRLLVAGIVNYVYERDHAVLTRLTVPADASGSLLIRASANGSPATRCASPSGANFR